MDYQFTNDWFAAHKAVWLELFAKVQPKKVLEIGSFEGQSTTFIIENIAGRAGASVYCIDPWQAWVGSVRYDQATMTSAENLFKRNTGLALEKVGGKVALNVLKGRSDDHMPALIAGGHKGSFDMIYVDGSHTAADAMVDLTLAYLLCRVGGLIICDDYLWFGGGGNPAMEPKMAVDAFTNAFRQRISIWRAPLYQLYLTKVG